jgi:hypothetical protein
MSEDLVPGAKRCCAASSGSEPGTVVPGRDRGATATLVCVRREGVARRGRAARRHG